MNEKGIKLYLRNNPVSNYLHRVNDTAWKHILKHEQEIINTIEVVFITTIILELVVLIISVS